MNPRRPRPRRASARRTFRRIGWTLAAGLLLLGAGLPALAPARVAPRQETARLPHSPRPALIDQVEDLAADGRFGEAAGLAAGAPAALRDFLLAESLQLWALAEPAEAARRALAEADPVLRARLLRLVAHAWADGERAAELPAYAASLADPASRRVLLETGLPRWVQRAPAASFDWLEQQPASADFDAARAALAGQLDLLAARIDSVADQAERITDPGLRRGAFAEVVATWRILDPAGVADRVARASTIEDIERTHLLETLSESPAVL